MSRIKYIVLAILFVIGSHLAQASVNILAGPETKNYKSKEAEFIRAEGLAVTRAGNVWMSVSQSVKGQKVVVLNIKSAAGTWTEAALVLSSDEFSVTNSILWMDPMGNLRIFYSLLNQEGTLQETYCMLCADPDGSASLMAPVKVGRGYPTGIPAIQPGGLLVLPAMESQVGPVVYSSANNGISWVRNEGPRDTPELQKAANNNPEFYVANPGELSMVLRSLGTAWSYRSSSSDCGRTWSKPTPFIYNPYADFAVSSLGGGKALIIKSGRYDLKKFHLQRGLYAYITPNDGEGWYGGLQIDSREHVGYPVVHVSRGKVYIAYTRHEKGENQIIYAETSEVEIEEAWGTLTTPPSVKNVVFTAGLSKAAYENRLVISRKMESWADKTLRICTYNIMFHEYSKNPNWAERRPSIKKVFEEYQFDVVGVQEPDTMMVRTMLEDLEGKYASVVNNEKYMMDNSDNLVPLNPIFYKVDRLELLDDGQIFFSDALATKGYDSWSVSRNCKWAKFRDKQTDKVFFVFNSHLDHRGLEAKECSPDRLLAEAEKLTQGYPAFFTGDFNFDENHPGYAKMVNSDWTKDAMLALPEKKRVNWEYFSMSRFKPMSTVAKSRTHLDHVFYTPNSVSILYWQQVIDSYEGVFGSDHLPIFVDSKIAN